MYVLYGHSMFCKSCEHMTLSQTCPSSQFSDRILSQPDDFSLTDLYILTLHLQLKYCSCLGEQSKSASVQSQPDYHASLFTFLFLLIAIWRRDI